MQQRIATRNIVIERPAEEVFVFISSAANWPKWALETCESIKPLPDGCWLTRSTNGAGTLCIVPSVDRRSVHFAISLREGEWEIDCRLCEQGQATGFELIFPQPEHCDEFCFDDYMMIAEHRLRRLKTLLEKSDLAFPPSPGR